LPGAAAAPGDGGATALPVKLPAPLFGVLAADAAVAAAVDDPLVSFAVALAPGAIPARAFNNTKPAVLLGGVPVVCRAAAPDVPTLPFADLIESLCWRQPVTLTVFAC
jgi:hypothetical protein